KVKLTIDVSPSDLILAAALIEQSCLNRVSVAYPRDVVVHVDGGICLMPRHRTQVTPAKTHIVKAGEAHVRYRFRRKKQWQVYAVLGGRDVAIGSGNERLRHTGAN